MKNIINKNIISKLCIPIIVKRTYFSYFILYFKYNIRIIYNIYNSEFYR